MSEMLDLVIGMGFLYLLLSLMITTINEMIAAFFNSRGIYLRDVIHGLIDNDEIDNALKEHSLIKSIVNSRLPSYLPEKSFALALLDTLAPLPSAAIRTPDSVRSALNQIPDGSLKQALLPLFAEAKGDVDQFVAEIEQWFKGGMDRANAWYKRYTQYWTLGIAAILVIGLNADTIRIGRLLSSDAALREQVVKQARKYLKEHPNPPSEPAPQAPAAPAPANEKAKDEKQAPAAGGDNKTADAPATTDKVSNEELARLMVELTDQLPVGWTQEEFDHMICAGPSAWLSWLIGCLLTTLAVSLGAPFWFDVMNKVANVRFNGQPPSEAKDARDGAAGTSR